MNFARRMSQPLLDESSAWQLLLGLKRRAASGQPLSETCDIVLDAHGDVRTAGLGQGWITVRPDQRPVFRSNLPTSDEADLLLELYLPLCVGRCASRWTVAHLGQSLDGYIALSSGESRYVTGGENALHMHRMRALADAVVVGRNTVAYDDPRLTTRLVPGDNPARVVLDPERRLDESYAVFRDPEATTLIVCDARRARETNGRYDVVRVPADGSGRFPPGVVLSALHARGLRRIFVEGGGITVSQFLSHGSLDRIQITIAPIFLGVGRRGISLPGVERLDEALRPPARRFASGQDVLFDCELSSNTERRSST